MSHQANIDRERERECECLLRAVINGKEPTLAFETVAAAAAVLQQSVSVLLLQAQFVASARAESILMEVEFNCAKNPQKLTESAAVAFACCEKFRRSANCFRRENFRSNSTLLCRLTPLGVGFGWMGCCCRRSRRRELNDLRCSKAGARFPPHHE